MSLSTKQKNLIENIDKKAKMLIAHGSNEQTNNFS